MSISFSFFHRQKRRGRIDPGSVHYTMVTHTQKGGIRVTIPIFYPSKMADSANEKAKSNKRQ